LRGKVHPNGHTQQEMPAGPKVGEPVPEVALPDLEGQTVELEDFRGEVTMVLFWNPGCGFCPQMLPELKAWEEAPQGVFPSS
jgi:thiol-disulfide isomerase/thioredoxin